MYCSKWSSMSLKSIESVQILPKTLNTYLVCRTKQDNRVQVTTAFHFYLFHIWTFEQYGPSMSKDGNKMGHNSYYAGDFREAERGLKYPYLPSSLINYLVIKYDLN